MNSQLEKVSENNKTFLIYKINEEDSIDRTSVNMLKNNEISHVLPISFTQIGQEKFLKYDVTSKITLSDAIRNPISKERFLAIFDGIFSGILESDNRFMIPNNTLLLDLNNIYFDEFNDYVYLIAFPVNVDSIQEIDFAAFTRTLTNSVQLQANDEFMTGKILNHLNQTQSFSVVEFSKFIKSLKNEKSAQPKQQAVKPKSVTPPVQQPQKIQNTNVASPGSIVIMNTPPVQQRRPVQNPTPVQPSGMKVPSKEGSMNVPSKQGGMNIPGKQVTTPAPNQPSSVPPSNQNEPKISLFYLLQHYNAENAALYKKQKEAKKNGGEKGKKSQGAMPVSNQNRQSSQAQYVPQQVTYVEQREPQKRNFGDTTVLNRKNKKKTTVLNGKTAPSPNAPKKAMLIRERTNEHIVITKVPFKLGASEDGDADYCLKGNTNISQCHAIINYQVSGYTIVDDHSTNGTYLNGNPLQPDKYMLLNPGNIVRMADEDFRFEIV